MRIIKATMAAVAAGILAITAQAAITGQWEFNDLTGAVGQPIGFLDGAGGTTETATEFGTTTTFGIPNINAQPANVMKFGVNQPSMGYTVPHGLSAIGGFNVNQYTILMDVLFPVDSTGEWRALLQTDVNNPPNDDAEFYLNEANGFGIGGQYQGTVPANTWVRLALVADLTSATPSVRKYINGAFVGQHAASVDQRFALTPDSFFLLFTDGYEGGIYTQPGYINSLQVHNDPLSDAYIAALGGPSAAGIPTEVQTRPFVRSISPAAGVNASPATAFSASIENGVTRLDTNTVRLTLNGQPVAPVVSTENNLTTVAYSAGTLFPPGSTQLWQLVFADTGTPAASITNTSQIVVANYTDLKLPAPIFFENFESTAEGALPSGWTNQSYVDIPYPDEDLTFLNSASFARWLVIDASRFAGTFGTYDNPAAEETDYQRVLLYDPVYVINGEAVQSLAQGKVAFGNSGYRQDGGSQVLYLYSPDFSTAGRTNVHLVFNSIWEQNQDSIGGVEYSTDGGQTWLPAVYYLNQGDIVMTDGAVDAVATLTAEPGDIASYFDELGNQVGGSYGALIGALVSQDLAPFISGRADDNARESKRVEMFRLAGADNKAAVRLRFLHAGTDSWYFGIDNVGVYSIVNVEAPVIASQPENVSSTVGDAASFFVQASGTGLAYQWYFDGQPLANQTNATLEISSVSLANEGSYFVRVSNSAGFVQSQNVTLAIAESMTAVWQFDNNLSPSTVGTLDYATAETQPLTAFKTTDSTTVPHIEGSPATYLEIGQLPAGAHGLHITAPTHPNGSGEYVNRYTMIWDILIPSPLNWTPLFNSNPANGNDADFYVDDLGRLGIGALGYSPEGTIAADQWYRLAFAADLASGVVTYYVNGAQVFQRTGDAIIDGRFALYSGNDEGPDVLLFSEPSGSYNHPILVNSFLFTDRTMTAGEIAALGGPAASGIAFDAPIEATIARQGNNVVIGWTGATGAVQVQKSESLTVQNWQDVPTPAGASSVTEPITGQAAFYRIRKL